MVPSIVYGREPDKQEGEIVYVIRAMEVDWGVGVVMNIRGSTGSEGFHQEAWRIPLVPVIMFFPLR